jgi:hypothetical protein
VSVQKAKSHKIGSQTQLKFIITQHARDTKLMESFIKKFDCGRLQVQPKSVEFVVSKMADLEGKIIPFFKKHPLEGNKNLEFLDFCKVVALMKTKSHLTESGLQQILDIRSGMNTGRNHMALLERSSSNLKVGAPVSLWGATSQRAKAKSNTISNALSSQNRTFHTNVKAAKRIGPHDKDVVSVIVGSLLGACTACRVVEGTRFVLKQNIANKDYCYWLYDFFHSRGYCSNLEPIMYTRRFKKADQVKEYIRSAAGAYEFNTFTFRSFNWIHKMFYTKGKKVVSLEIEKYLTPLALAIWIMSQGKFVAGRVELCTYFHTRQDMDKLVNILNNRYGLMCSFYTREEGLYRIVINTQCVELLQTIVSPFMLPSLKYRVGMRRIVRPNPAAQQQGLSHGSFNTNH